ncbi:hypothetical protein Leryth_013306 [Lithospermum erythrorhizon]|nr:hypothetical protein Leryth_013306 [Lithospermum erythrorhizon]
MTETGGPKPRRRPIVRLGLFLISYSFLVSVICCTAAVGALLLLPLLAKTTYVSENALMPGSASSMLSSEDVLEASSLVSKIMSLDPSSVGTGVEIRSLIAQHVAELGGEVNYHKFQPQLQKFHPLYFFSGPDEGTNLENNSCSSFGVNTVGIIRALRGDGKESIVLVTPYNAVNISHAETLSLGVAYSVLSLLSRVTWLAKDIIWLAADSQHGEYTAVASWLRAYNAPVFGYKNAPQYEICHENDLSGMNMCPTEGTARCDGFRRAGTMAAALVIKVAGNSPEFEKDSLSIFAEASNGQMPNLDLINIVNYLAVHGQGLHVKVNKVWSLLDSWWLKTLGRLLELVGEVARSLNPTWNFGKTVSEYVEGTATLASSLYHQALGVPTGPHGAFRDYQVDSITMEISRHFSSNYNFRNNEFLHRSGRLVEGVIRSVNNLLEKFHQSFFLYLLTSPNKFVSVGVYMIAFALLIAPLPLVAASLYADANKRNPDAQKDVLLSPEAENEASISFRSWKWLHAARTVFIIHLWGVIVALLPYFIYQIPGSSPFSNLSLWVVLSTISMIILKSSVCSSTNIIMQHQSIEWALLKSVTVAAAFVGLSLMSVINFAAAEIGALLLVPLCLMATPLRFAFNIRTPRAIAQGVGNLLLIILGFPPVTYFVVKGVVEGYDMVRVDDFWIFLESLWDWNSATYLYICMIHLPCWVLCISILLHSCQ